MNASFQRTLSLRRIATWAVLVAPSLFFTTTACSTDNIGFVAGEITKADGAWVADIYSLGGQLRTRAEDPGLSLGVQRRSYVFVDNTDYQPDPGWHYFSVPLPKGKPVALDTRALGLEVNVPGTGTSLTLGLSATTLLAHLPSDHDGAIQLRYAPGEPDATYLRYCTGMDECEDFFAD